MTTSEVVELEATGITYYSELDEASFFEWMKAIGCVVKFEGRGKTLYISVDGSALGEHDLRELIALFNRYGVDMKQLARFNKEEFAPWFRNEHAYWHKRIFN